MKTKLILISTILLLSLNLFSQTDSAKIFKHTIPDNGDLGSSPYFFLKSDNPDNDKFPLKATYVDVNIAGIIADVSVKQVYINESENTLEAIYIFPGSSESAVYAMNMQIGKRILIAKIKEKVQAKKDYNKAKSEGKTASLLEQERPNVFQMSVANILPGDSIVVELKYTELINSTDGIYEFRFPEVVAPRYSENSDEEWIASSVNQIIPSDGEYFVDFAYDIDFDLNITINAGMSVSEINSPSHEIITKSENKSASVKIADSEKKIGMKDFVLDFSLSGNNVVSGLLAYETENENYFALVVQPPKSVETEQIPPREYIFIVDVSGSMQGFPINVSKTLIDNLVSGLRPDDIFNVMVFSYGNSILADVSLNATNENIEKAKVFLNANYSSGGGTQLLQALHNALDLKPNGNYSRTFIILTDGEVTCESEAFKLVRDNLAEANLFAIGIGSSINDYIIKGLAYSGMGEPYFIESQAEANEVGEKFIKTVSNPVLTNIEIISEDVEIYDIEPKNVPDVFSNRPIIIYGKYKNSNIGNITIKGISGNENYEQKFYLLDNKSEKNIALKYLWARNRIKYLADYEDYYNELTNVEKITEVTEIGLKYGLLTKYTSFIAIDSLVRESQGCIENTESGLEQGLADNETFNNTNTGSVRFTIPNVVDTLTTYDMELATVDYLSDAAYLSQTETFSEEVEVFGTEEEVIIEQVFECFQISEQPAFAGGDVALQQYISENLQYPKDAWENDIQGTVYIRFEVKASGEIGQIQVLRSVDPSLDAEAVRIIKSLPKFSPGKQNGYTVSVWFVIPIKFNLE